MTFCQSQIILVKGILILQKVRGFLIVEALHFKHLTNIPKNPLAYICIIIYAQSINNWLIDTMLVLFTTRPGWQDFFPECTLQNFDRELESFAPWEGRDDSIYDMKFSVCLQRLKGIFELRSEMPCIRSGSCKEQEHVKAKKAVQ